MTSSVPTTTVAVIGDVHATWSLLDRVLERIQAEPKVDGILLVGDLGDPGLGRMPAARIPERQAAYQASLERLWSRLDQTGIPWRFVPGNHDLPDIQHDNNADGRLVELAGLSIYGVGGAGPARFGFPYEWSEADIWRRAEQAPARFDVLLTHTPPADTTLDKVLRGDLHVGSKAIRGLARRADFLVCGHIHEAGGVEQLGECLMLNAGALGRPYGRPQLGWIRRSPDRDGVTWENLAADGGDRVCTITRTLDR